MELTGRPARNPRSTLAVARDYNGRVPSRPGPQIRTDPPMRQSDRPRFVRVLRVRFRRLQSRLDRLAPALLLWVPSWGTSLLIHGVALLLLALYFYARAGGPHDREIRATIPSQLTEDVLSLVPSDHSGDPFTDRKSD